MVVGGLTDPRIAQQQNGLLAARASRAQLLAQQAERLDARRRAQVVALQLRAIIDAEMLSSSTISGGGGGGGGGGRRLRGAALDHRQENHDNARALVDEASEDNPATDDDDDDDDDNNNNSSETEEEFEEFQAIDGVFEGIAAELQSMGASADQVTTTSTTTTTTTVRSRIVHIDQNDDNPEQHAKHLPETETLVARALALRLLNFDLLETLTGLSVAFLPLHLFNPEAGPDAGSPAPGSSNSEHFCVNFGEPHAQKMVQLLPTADRKPALSPCCLVVWAMEDNFLHQATLVVSDLASRADYATLRPAPEFEGVRGFEVLATSRSAIAFALRFAVEQQHPQCLEVLMAFALMHDMQLVNYIYPSGDSLLHYASRQQSTSCIKVLLELGADFSTLNQVEGKTPLMLACQSFLATSGILYLEYCRRPRLAATNSAISDNDVSAIDEIKNADPDEAPAVVHPLDVTDRSGNTALHTAVLFGNVRMAELLLEAGARMTAKNANGDTPLLTGARNKSAAFVRLFIDANPHAALAEDAQGRNIVHLVISWCSAALVQLLHSALLDVDSAFALKVFSAISTVDQASALHYAVAANKYEIVSYLLETVGLKPDLCLESTPWFTPFALAVHQSRATIASLLLKHGANAEVRVQHSGGFWQLVIHTAALKNDVDMLRVLLARAPAACLGHTKTMPSLLCATAASTVGSAACAHLLENGAKHQINLRFTENGLTPLMYAARYGCAATVELLLQHGADLFVCAKSGATPLSIASERGNVSVFDVLARTIIANPRHVTRQVDVLVCRALRWHAMASCIIPMTAHFLGTSEPSDKAESDPQTIIPSSFGSYVFPQLNPDDHMDVELAQLQATSSSSALLAPHHSSSSMISKTERASATDLNHGKAPQHPKPAAAPTSNTPPRSKSTTTTTTSTTTSSSKATTASIRNAVAATNASEPAQSDSDEWASTDDSASDLQTDGDESDDDDDDDDDDGDWETDADGSSDEDAASASSSKARMPRQPARASLARTRTTRTTQATEPPLSRNQPKRAWPSSAAHRKFSKQGGSTPQVQQAGRDTRNQSASARIAPTATPTAASASTVKPSSSLLLAAPVSTLSQPVSSSYSMQELRLKPWPDMFMALLNHWHLCSDRVKQEIRRQFPSYASPSTPPPAPATAAAARPAIPTAFKPLVHSSLAINLPLQPEPLASIPRVSASWMGLVDVSGRTALHTAVARDQLELVAHMLRSETARLEAIVAATYGPLPDSFRGAKEVQRRFGHHPVFTLPDGRVRPIVDLGLNLGDGKGATPLHYAARVSVQMTELLLSFGAYIESRDSTGRTPLHSAMSWSGSKIEVMRHLISVGANPRTRANNGDTAAHDAAGIGKTEVLELLHSVSPRLLTMDGHLRCKPLMRAAASDKAALEFIMSKVKPSAVFWFDAQGNSPMHYAAKYGQVECVEHLMRTAPHLLFIQNLQGQLPENVVAHATNPAARNLPISMRLRGEIVAGTDVDAQMEALHEMVHKRIDAMMRLVRTKPHLLAEPAEREFRRFTTMTFMAAVGVARKAAVSFVEVDDATKRDATLLAVASQAAAAATAARDAHPTTKQLPRAWVVAEDMVEVEVEVEVEDETPLLMRLKKPTRSKRESVSGVAGNVVAWAFAVAVAVVGGVSVAKEGSASDSSDSDDDSPSNSDEQDGDDNNNDDDDDEEEEEEDDNDMPDTAEEIAKLMFEDWTDQFDGFTSDDDDDDDDDDANEDGDDEDDDPRMSARQRTRAAANRRMRRRAAEKERERKRQELRDKRAHHFAHLPARESPLAPDVPALFSISKIIAVMKNLTYSNQVYTTREAHQLAFHTGAMVDIPRVSLPYWPCARIILEHEPEFDLPEEPDSDEERPATMDPDFNDTSANAAARRMRATLERERAFSLLVRPRMHFRRWASPSDREADVARIAEEDAQRPSSQLLRAVRQLEDVSDDESSAEAEKNEDDDDDDDLGLHQDSRIHPLTHAELQDLRAVIMPMMSSLSAIATFMSTRALELRSSERMRELRRLALNEKLQEAALKRSRQRRRLAAFELVYDEL
ncbi:hypothetical protein CAOG_08630 [Capsaspora owczarzaki ATCC 30864]|uniref:Uncharacterized protein n=1 Tax=Capsaspora owczarzaki (strain ATCC 30864) TaxID=595528 RepID=A0A0D2WLV0_CAPO3|nr:hypothetical protein CAOG_08630 [Capsaspora owczarzaki ATCC 30864]KJE91610.1 hypothetical protein CAOG_008630 [Capsaspora owczarzaki ATCC 30864]|eukprot:XP_011270230.1 hypothetical protein CAOG_08630 [Capsaspora owczarzaki ATCC 30864]